MCTDLLGDGSFNQEISCIYLWSGIDGTLKTKTPRSSPGLFDSFGWKLREALDIFRAYVSLCVCIFESKSCSVTQAGLELLDSGDPSASVS